MHIIHSFRFKFIFISHAFVNYFPLYCFVVLKLTAVTLLTEIYLYQSSACMYTLNNFSLTVLIINGIGVERSHEHKG